MANFLINMANFFTNACFMGDIETVKKLIPLVNIEGDFYGGTGLTLASSKGHIEIIKLLLERGADINKVNSFDENAIMCACKNGHLDVVNYLILKGADVNHTNYGGETALLATCRYEIVEDTTEKIDRYIKIIKLLLVNGANINHVNENGYTALMLACQRGNKEIAKLLILNGCDVNCRNSKGISSFILSFNDKSNDIAKLILSTDYNYNQDKEGMIKFGIYESNINFINSYIGSKEYHIIKNNICQTISANIFSSIVLISDGYYNIK